jgi:peptidyl-prolyl cis-trans isomerase SDCCAG10
MLNAFKARLESVDTVGKTNGTPKDSKTNGDITTKNKPAEPAAADDDEEATLCDLHFIANCQSCSKWDDPDNKEDGDDEDDENWMKHTLSFAKDRLGKDLNWKKKNEEDLVVIDPREREREVRAGKNKDRDKGKGKKW